MKGSETIGGAKDVALVHLATVEHVSYMNFFISSEVKLCSSPEHIIVSGLTCLYPSIVTTKVKVKCKRV
ncbi:hypothetical protein GLYMA_04G046900v4 [Glycine max]|uniref:Uncharacterized protein n=2 Tax=Glycine subgen. Soja TaxID=1462606 RepID=A0A0R0K3X4_SOYBN|nr:hypothetical protein JHK87_008936 [Glycine soja]KAG5048220.1 hypothetical protein JHK85_009323 [Glycine max]KAG5065339.1 hypothetical protein JHK86_009070 [Glycine max]KAH1109792.1 hypothetical protein GYH30_008943 [Glycine max]KRH61436.1 hypothetical protein GLYMA_04G046900v4 [Glycine max]